VTPLISPAPSTTSWLTNPLCPVRRRSPVTQINLMGYGVSFLAVGWYNYQKLQRLHKQAEQAKLEQQSQKEAGLADDEKAPLMSKA